MPDPDLLTRVREEVRSRMTELRPLVEEHDRLEAAMRALESDTGDARQTGSSPASGRRRTARPRPKRSRPRKRAARGANREVVLRAVKERPGASAGEIAQASGVGRATLYNLLARLVGDGELERQELPGGQPGYRLAEAGAAAPAQPESTSAA